MPEMIVPADSLPIPVEVVGALAPDVAAFAEQRIRDVVRLSRRPVLHARVRVIRHPDPAVARPVVAQANLDVDGRLVRAQVAAATAHEAVDALHGRLLRRVRHDAARVAGTWEDRRGRRSAGDHEWQHGDLPTPRAPWFPRPADEREIVRHTSVTPSRCALDEAAADLADMGYDFHLFTEVGSGQDSVLYRSGGAALRLAQVDPRPAELAPHAVEVHLSPRRAPLLTTEEAVEQLAAWDRPFLFFLDGERGQGAVLYHRYDGHYGLITPAEPSDGGEV